MQFTMEDLEAPLSGVINVIRARLPAIEQIELSNDPLVTGVAGLSDVNHELVPNDINADIVWQQNMFKCIDASVCVLVREHPLSGKQLFRWENSKFTLAQRLLSLGRMHTL